MHALQGLAGGRLGRRLALSAAALAAGGFIAQLCFLTVEAIVARRLGRAEYGTLSTVYGICFTSLYFYELGMSWKLNQDGSRDPRAIPVLLGTVFVLVIALAGVVYTALLLLLPRLGYEPAAVTTFAVFFPYAVLFALQETLASRNAARLQMHVNAAYQASTPIVVLGLVALTVLIVPSIEAVAGAYVLGALLVTIVWSWNTFRAERPRIELARTGEILRGSYLYGVSGFLFQMSYRIEVIALSLLRGMAEAGLFAAADKLTDLGMKVALVGSRVTAPVLFRQSRHEPVAYARSCKVVIRGASILGAGTGLVLGLIAEPLMLGLFGGAFHLSAVVLTVLAPSVATRIALVGIELTLSASGQQQRRVRGVAGGVATSTACNFALIPAWGALGAAAARLVGDVVHVILVIFGSSRPLPAPRRAVAGWMATPLLTSAATAALVTQATDHPWPRLVLGVPLFAAALVATRSVRLAEVRELWQAVKLGRG